ncbi:MAG: hypothetical protein PW792_17650 [Acidobacteriaceae bacterium]|nr:hypothetical protein [Acidobacteriaceae bacterium]
MPKFRPVLTVVLLALFSFAASHAFAQTPISIYVQAGTGGFAANGAGDSATDIAANLQKKRGFQIVDSPANADVILRVDSRNTRQEAYSITTNANESKDGKSATATTTQNKKTILEVHATIVAGDFQLPLLGASTFSWRLSAGDITSQLEHWTKENYAKLVEKRIEREKSRPSPAVAQAALAEPAMNADIAPGMTEAQVLRTLGPADKKFSFGPKSLWTYRGLQVIFENGKVSDVKF